MRIKKPGGLYAFYFPYLIGLSYAACIAQPIISPALLLSTSEKLLVWNVFLRGAACTVNDNFNREYDRVARCRLRPIARGAVTPTQLIGGTTLAGLSGEYLKNLANEEKRCEERMEDENMEYGSLTIKEDVVSEM